MHDPVLKHSRHANPVEYTSFVPESVSVFAYAHMLAMYHMHVPTHNRNGEAEKFSLWLWGKCRRLC